MAFSSRFGNRTRRLVLGWLLGSLSLLAVITTFGPWLVCEQPIDAPDAILVLGSHEHERLPEAVRLARRWPGAMVVLTQPVTPTQFNCQDCANRVRTLGAAGVPSWRVRVLQPRVRNTFEELQAAEKWAREHQARRLLIVTSPYHTRRVSWLSRAVFRWTAVGIVASAVEGGVAFPWWSRRYDRRYVLYEWAAIVSNSWRYRLTPSVWSQTSPQSAL